MKNINKIKDMLVKQNIPVLEVHMADDPSIEDDSIKITDNIEVQVGWDYMIVGRKINDATFEILPERTAVADVIKDLKQLLSE